MARKKTRIDPYAWMTGEIKKVDGPLAEKWLNRPRRNRDIRRAGITRLKEDFLAGRYFAIPDPVMFDRRGRLGNAQHRLTAIKELWDEGYEITLPMKVCYNVPEKAFEVFDTGSARSLKDLRRLNGEKMTDSDTGTAKAMFYGAKSPTRAPSVPHLHDFWKIHGTTIREVTDEIFQGRPVKGITIAAVKATVCRARVCGVDVKPLAEFARLLMDGTPTGPMFTERDRFVIEKGRNWLLSNTAVRTAVTGSKHEKIFRRMQTVLALYLDSKAEFKKVLRTIKTDIWTITMPKNAKTPSLKKRAA